MAVAADDRRKGDRSGDRACHHDGGDDPRGSLMFFASLADNPYRETYRQRGRDLKANMGSFRVKLAFYFLLLSLLPMAAAFWGFSTVAARAETRRVDARLQAELRAVTAAYQAELEGAATAAAAVARDPRFERALVTHDRRALERLLRRYPFLTVTSGPGFRVGPRVGDAATRQVAVVGPGGVRGVLIAAVPLNATLVHRLASRTGIDAEDRVVLLRQGAVVAGLAAVGDRVRLAPGATGTVRLGGQRYRALVAGSVGSRPVTTLGVVSSQRAIDAANRGAVARLLLGLLVSLAVVAIIAFLEGRAIVRTIRRLVEAAHAIARGDLRQRVPADGRDELALLGRAFNEMASQLETRLDELGAERARLRAAISRFGDALAATHDDHELRRVIVETAVQASGAGGGMLVGEAGDIVETGSTANAADRIEVPLESGSIDFGSLTLFGEAFSDDDRRTAASLASQAFVALDNARLHRIVEKQARIDELTGLANRRHFEEQLAAELARVGRFGGPLAIVLADLDDFKDVNDRFGHPVGDVVLREFARALEEAIREIDIAARWGGEELVLLLPGTDLAGAAQVAERARAVLEGRVVVSPDGDPIRVTASFGVAAYPEAGSADQLLETADAALYEAKRAGKNRVASEARRSVVRGGAYALGGNSRHEG
jgi:diguanylate cyclase (GGDEF)-like protein